MPAGVEDAVRWFFFFFSFSFASGGCFLSLAKEVSKTPFKGEGISISLPLENPHPETTKEGGPRPSLFGNPSWGKAAPEGAAGDVGIAPLRTSNEGASV